jgi:hypothetical protein
MLCHPYVGLVQSSPGIFNIMNHKLFKLDNHMKNVKYITISLGDEDFEKLSMAKGDRTWREYIMKDVLNQYRRQKLLALS